MMHYRIGDQVPLDYARGITGFQLPKPVWHALLVMPQREKATREALKAKGVHACFPEREKAITVRGKQHKRKFPVLSQIVYAKFGAEPNWDVLRYRRLIRGVFSYNGRPIALHGDIIAAVMGLPTEAEKLEEARRELLRVREGERAEMNRGPFAGYLVDVTSVREGKVWFETLTGIKGEAPEEWLTRAQGID